MIPVLSHILQRTKPAQSEEIASVLVSIGIF